MQMTLTPSNPRVLPTSEEEVSVLGTLATELAVYSDTDGLMMLFAPKGWTCSAAYGADAGGGGSRSTRQANPFRNRPSALVGCYRLVRPQRSSSAPRPRNARVARWATLSSLYHRIKRLPEFFWASLSEEPTCP